MKRNLPFIFYIRIDSISVTPFGNLNTKFKFFTDLFKTVLVLVNII